MKRIVSVPGMDKFLLAVLFAISCDLFLSTIWGQESSSPADDAIVHLTVFTSPECDQCRQFKETIIPELQKSYGASLEVTYIDTDEGGNYELLSATERRYGDMGNEFPVVFCGERVFGGLQEIQAGLREAIEGYRQAGGVAAIDLMAEPMEVAAAGGATVYLAYVDRPGCQKCGRVDRMLAAFQRRYPHLSVARFDLALSQNKKLAEAMGRRCGLPEERRLVAPALFVGQDALVGEEIRDDSLRHLVEKYRASGNEPIWEVVASDTAGAAGNIVQRFQALCVPAIILAGLLDGINPCAFATIVFFISYLALVGRQRREVLWAGVSFTGAVFLTYLGIGLGFFQFMQWPVFTGVISRAIFGLMAAVVFVLGVISLYDFVMLRRGRRAGEMKLQLPLFLKQRIHATIRAQSKSGRVVAGALICGVVISLLELACTGQVYLPTIIFVAGNPQLKARAYFYLVMYNLFFIVPLAAVFLVNYLGVTSQRIGAVVEAHLGKVKLALGIFFLMLSALLVYTMWH